MNNILALIKLLYNRHSLTSPLSDKHLVREALKTSEPLSLWGVLNCSL